MEDALATLFRNEWGAPEGRPAAAHLPHAHVHVVGAGENVRRVPAEAHRKHALHAPRVVHLPRARLWQSSEPH